MLQLRSAEPWAAQRGCSAGTDLTAACVGSYTSACAYGFKGGNGSCAGEVRAGRVPGSKSQPNLRAHLTEKENQAHVSAHAHVKAVPACWASSAAPCDSPAGYFGFLTNLFCRCARLSSSAIYSKVCTSFTLPYRLLSMHAYPANLPLVYSRLSSALLQPPFVSPVPGEPNAKPPSLKEQIVLVSAAARAPLPGMAAADVVQAAALLQHTFISGAFGGRNGFSSSPRPVLCAVYLLTPRGVEHHISKAGHTGV